MLICRFSRIVSVMATLAGVLLVAPAFAQTAKTDGTEAYAMTSPIDNPADRTDADITEIPASQTSREAPVDNDGALANALIFNPSDFATAAPTKQFRALTLPTQALDMNRIDRPDGSASISMKQPLATEWDTKIGADLNPASTPSDTPGPPNPLPWTKTADQGSGAAWANVGLPNIGSIDARVDPTQDQGKVGATVGRSMPIGSKFAVTLQDTVSVIDTFSVASISSPVPMPTSPIMSATQPMPRVWGNEKMVKIELVPTGTTFAAGVATATNDPASHNKFSAEQKLYGPLHVTTSVTDYGQATADRRISAGFKLNW
jgi:hypothetical protein